MMATRHSENLYYTSSKIGLVSIQDGSTKFIEPGQVIAVQIPEITAREHNTIKGYYGMLKEFVSSMPEWAARKFWYNLLNHLAVYRSVDVQTLHLMLKAIFDIKSVSYEELGENKMKEYKKATEFLLKEMGAAWGWRGEKQ